MKTTSSNSNFLLRKKAGGSKGTRKYETLGLTVLMLAGASMFALLLAQIQDASAAAPIYSGLDAMGATASTNCGPGWNDVASLNPSTVNNYLLDVAVIASNDIWTVGYYPNNGVYLTLAEHWNGSAWSVIPSVNPSATNNELHSVAARSSSDVWAVGEYENNVGNTRTLIEHWDGISWTQSTSSDPGSIIDGPRVSSDRKCTLRAGTKNS